VKKIGTLTLVTVVALGTALGAAGCGTGETVTERRYEDCEVSDQEAREDDCGYWERFGSVTSGSRPGADWNWVWFTWVTVGRNSSPPDGWVPPAGTNPPYEDIEVKKPKKPKTTAPRPASTTKKTTSVSTGNQGRTEKSYTPPKSTKRRP
jgi:hypothetical protein